MNPNDVNPMVATEAKSRIDTNEIRKVSFWVSQIFILAATVAGVYLAANQGFRQAIAYEKLMGDKSNYYLRLSLRNEISDNIELVREYMKRIETGGPAARKAPFKLETFIWESMKFSSATLETPSDLLTESRNFYRTVADIQEKVSTLTFGVETAKKQLTELIERMEKDVLPRFDANIKALSEHLAKNDIEL